MNNAASKKPQKAEPPGLFDLYKHLTERDLAIIDTLGRHKLATVAMLAPMFFPSHRAASVRLLTLTKLGVLTRFVTPRTRSYRYVLDWHGQAIFAVRNGQKPPTKNTALWRIHSIAASRQRLHKEGVNAFFAEIFALAASHQGWAVTQWLAENEAAIDLLYIRPDGAGTLEGFTSTRNRESDSIMAGEPAVTCEGARHLRFWVEYDTGSEPLHNVVSKISRYDREYTQGKDGPRVLLAVLTSVGRERNLHANVPQVGVDWATTVNLGESHTAEASMAVRQWRIPGHSERLSWSKLFDHFAK